MPTVTLPAETLRGLGVSRDDLIPVFTLRARDSVAALLVSRGFDMTQAVRVVELARGEGFVFTQ